jgi:predicted GNAT family N-acyltransferase
MNIRPVREEDIEQVIALFRANYGEDYAMPQFYDPEWVKRGVYSDHIIWLVIEEDGRVVASGACILNAGDYNDQIGEIGRLVVDPSMGGRGLGRAMLSALVDASDERVEFAFAEARTVHPKTQRIDDRIGLVALGFLPMYYMMSWRESLVLSGQLFGNGRRLRQPGAAEVIPAVAPLAELSLRNLELDETFRVRPNARPYPLDLQVPLSPLTESALPRLLRIEQGRLIEPEMFSAMQVDLGLAQLTARKAQYLVAADDERTFGAVGFVYDAHNKSVRLIELIGQDEAVKGSLLRQALELAEQTYPVEMLKCDVSAQSPRLQQTLLEMGFLPAAYVPGMVFHASHRLDVVKMIKLNVAWELGPIELTPPSQKYYDVVVPAFERASVQRIQKVLPARVPLLDGLTRLELEFFRMACEAQAPAAGAELQPGVLYVVTAGQLRHNGRGFGSGECVGTAPVMEVSNGAETGPVAGPDTQVLALSPAALKELADRYPRLGVKLYRNLAAHWA